MTTVVFEDNSYSLSRSTTSKTEDTMTIDWSPIISDTKNEDEKYQIHTLTDSA